MTRLSSTQVGLVVGSVAVVLLVFAACGIGVVVGLKRLTRDAGGVNDSPTNGPAKDTVGDSKQVYSRDEFKRLAMGKSPAELIAIFGRPGTAFDHEDNTPRSWIYHQRVTNPATAKAGSAILRFEKQKVVSIEW